MRLTIRCVLCIWCCKKKHAERLELSSQPVLVAAQRHSAADDDSVGAKKTQASDRIYKDQLEITVTMQVRSQADIESQPVGVLLPGAIVQVVRRAKRGRMSGQSVQIHHPRGTTGLDHELWITIITAKGQRLARTYHAQHVRMHHADRKQKVLALPKLTGRSMWIRQSCDVTAEPDEDTDKVGRLAPGTKIRVVKGVKVADGTVWVAFDTIHGSRDQPHAWVKYFTPPSGDQIAALNEQYSRKAPGAKLTHTVVKTTAVRKVPGHDTSVIDSVRPGQHVCVSEVQSHGATAAVGRIADDQWIDMSALVPAWHCSFPQSATAMQGKVHLSISGSWTKGHHHTCTSVTLFCLLVASAAVFIVVEYVEYIDPEIASIMSNQLDFLCFGCGHSSGSSSSGLDYVSKYHSPVAYNLLYLMGILAVCIPVAVILLWRMCHSKHFDVAEFAPGARVHKFGYLAGRDGYVKSWDASNPNKVIVDFSEFGGRKAVSIHQSLLTPVDETSTETLRHSANARAALYLFSVCMLTESCIKAFDFSEQRELSKLYSKAPCAVDATTWLFGDASCSCTNQDGLDWWCTRKVYTLDSNADIALPLGWDACGSGMNRQECQNEVTKRWESGQYNDRILYLLLNWGLAGIGLVVYTVYLPLEMFMHLKILGPKGRATREIYQENGWVLLKYRPGAWWFEGAITFCEQPLLVLRKPHSVVA